MILYLIRHGATETSGETFAGQSDVALTARGRRMAQDVRAALAQRCIDRVLSSPLSRARDTAHPLAAHLGLAIETDPRLMEIDFGIYEGRSKADLGLSLRKAHAHQRIPQGEALIDVWRRAGAVAQDLRGRGGDVAIFGHYWINRMLCGHLSGLDFDAACRNRAYRPATGSIVLWDGSGPPRPFPDPGTGDGPAGPAPG